MAVTGVAQATQTINTGIGALANNYETFLHLLTTQLKNQDPLSPLDNNQFTQQLTQMTGVQQQLLTNQLLTQIIGQNQADLGGGAINLIGKLVTVRSPDAVLTEGAAQWTYELAAAASDTTLDILDSRGQVVWSGRAEDNAKGAHTLSWDGKALNGQTMPDGGTYTLRITAKDANGKAVDASGVVTGLATRIQTIDGQTMLTVGAIRTPLTAVTGVEYAPPPST